MEGTLVDTPAVSVVPVARRKAVDSPEVLERVKEGLALVKGVARQVRQKFAPRLDVEDLESAATEALLLAARSYDPARGSFHTWATLRMQGAMIDSFRTQGGLPRRVYRQWREEVSAASGETPAPDAGVQADGGRRRKGTRFAGVVGLWMTADPDTLGEIPCPDLSPEEQVAHREIAREASRRVARLPDAEWRLIKHHDIDEQKLTEAAARMGVSKSWVSRQHTRAIESVRCDVQRWASEVHYDVRRSNKRAIAFAPPAKPVATHRKAHAPLLEPTTDKLRDPTDACPEQQVEDRERLGAAETSPPVEPVVADLEEHASNEPLPLEPTTARLALGNPIAADAGPLPAAAAGPEGPEGAHRTEDGSPLDETTDKAVRERGRGEAHAPPANPSDGEVLGPDVSGEAQGSPRARLRAGSRRVEGWMLAEGATRMGLCPAIEPSPPSEPTRAGRRATRDRRGMRRGPHASRRRAQRLRGASVGRLSGVRRRSGLCLSALVFVIGARAPPAPGKIWEWVRGKNVHRERGAGGYL